MAAILWPLSRLEVGQGCRIDQMGSPTSSAW